MIPTGGLGASLAFEDSDCLASAIAEQNFLDDTNLRLKIVQAWEKHRKERLHIVQTFTNRNRSLRQPGSSWLMQKVKEWLVWGLFLVIGPSFPASQIYGYDTETFKSMTYI
jgi:2-polyprenyl-6-methoxyphenol hydroxylase-like FAD-dependent oxidoreductase